MNYVKDSFDMSFCKVMFTGDKFIICDELANVMHKRGTYDKKISNRSFTRVDKYVGRGFTITNLDSVPILKEHIKAKNEIIDLTLESDTDTDTDNDDAVYDPSESDEENIRARRAAGPAPRIVPKFLARDVPSDSGDSSSQSSYEKIDIVMPPDPANAEEYLRFYQHQTAQEAKAAKKRDPSDSVWNGQPNQMIIKQLSEEQREKRIKLPILPGW